MALCAVCVKILKIVTSKHTLFRHFFVASLLTYKKSWGPLPLVASLPGQLMACQKIGGQKPITGFPYYPKLELPIKLLVS